MGSRGRSSAKKGPSTGTSGKELHAPWSANISERPHNTHHPTAASGSSASSRTTAQTAGAGRQLAPIAYEPSPCTLEEGGKRALRAAFKTGNLKHGKKVLPGLAPERILSPKPLCQPSPVIEAAKAELHSTEAVEKKRAVVSTDSSAADLGPIAAAAEAKPAVTAPVINISANATAFAQQVAPAWKTPIPVMNESIWAPVLDAPAEPKDAPGKSASMASKIIPKTRRGWACLGAGIAIGIAATVGLLRRS